MEDRNLRPKERRILELRDQGVGVDEIAEKFQRSPGWVERVIEWTDIPRSGSRQKRSSTPIERRVLALRQEGEDHATIADRFKRSARFIRQVEGMAHFRRGLRLLRESSDEARKAATSTD